MKPALVVGAIIAATLAAYFNTIPGAFIYDDRSIIVRNPLIRRLNQIPQLFRTSYWDAASGSPEDAKGGLYRPLTMTSYSLNYAAGKLDPAGYHLVNLLLHLGVALLFGLLCSRLGFTPFTAGTAALLFSVLPIHTEAVSNVVGRAELLSAFFILLAWILVARNSTAMRIVLAAFAFIAALLSKENAAAFLPALVLTDYVTQPKTWRALARDRLPVWVALGGTLFLTWEWRTLVLGRSSQLGTMPYFTDQSALRMALTMSRFIGVHYFVPMLSGLGLCADYTRPSFTDARLSDPLAWACGFLALSALSIGGYFSVTRKNTLAFCAILFFILLLPVLHILVPIEVIGAERFLYLPSIAFCLAVGITLQWAVDTLRLDKNFATWIVVALTCWYGASTFVRNRVWASEDRFWQEAMREAPKSPRAWNGLGVTLMHQGKYDAAQELFHKAADLNPLLEDAYYNAGECYFLKGDWVAAKRVFQAYLQVKPYDPGARHYLGLINAKALSK